MGKTIHPLPNFDVDPAIRSDNVAKVLMVDDFVGDDVKMAMHVLGEEGQHLLGRQPSTIVSFLKPLLVDRTNSPHVNAGIFLPGYIPQGVMADGLSTRV